MGMFDEVVGDCVGCGDRMVIQSKSGDCTLATYSAEQTPTEIAVDVEGKVVFCENCGTRHRLVAYRPIAITPLCFIKEN